MAKVQSPFEIRGSVGNTTYFKNEYGQQMKEKGGPTAWQVKHLDRFTNTRLNAAEWKQATAASKLVRHAMCDLLRSVKNIRLSGRMNGLMLAAIHGDTVHDYGERVASNGNLSVLPGFEFNHNLSLEDALPLNVEHCFSLEGGKLALNIPAFRLRKKKGIPKDATHYRLVSCMLSIDFDKRTYHQDKRVSELHAMGRKAGAAFSIEQVAQPHNDQGCFWLMGIEFYKLVNGKPELVRGGALRVMEWVPSEPTSEPGFIGLNGLGGNMDQAEDMVITTVAEETATMEECSTAYMEVMEDLWDSAYQAGARFVETLTEFAVVNAAAEVLQPDAAATAAAPDVCEIQGLPHISGVAGCRDFEAPGAKEGVKVGENKDQEFEKSLRVLLPVEGYRRREGLKIEVLMDNLGLIFSRLR